jgi:hypothetical protein
LRRSMTRTSSRTPAAPGARSSARRLFFSPSLIPNEPCLSRARSG